MSSGNKFCKKCSCETERYKDGRCKPCIRKKNASWAASHKDAVNEKSRRWNAANAESKRATNAEYREKNRASINAKRKAKRDANLSEARAQYAKKNALRRKATGQLSPGIVIRLLISQRWQCVCCNAPIGRNYHIDHIVPLSRGGTNTDDNVQILLPRCNQQKYTQTHDEFMLARRKKELPSLAEGGKNTAPG